MKSNLRRTFALSVIGLSAAGLVTATGIGVTYMTQPNEAVRFTVNDKVVKPVNKSSVYLVMTDKGVFENSDSLSRWKFNSSDLQNEIKAGCTYDAKVYGFRNNFLSTYKNVIEATHVPTATCPTPQGPQMPRL
jgi:hypothetical protein